MIRFHAMRRTLWVATPSVARIAHASSTTKLLGPKHQVREAARRQRHLRPRRRLDRSAKEQVLAALHRAGEASTRQLGEAVPALRQPIELSPGKPNAATQHAHVRIMLHLGFEGVVVRSRPMGSWINSQYRWAAMDDWVPGGILGMDPREASAELVRRWLHTFGPGTTADVQWWTGWTSATPGARWTTRAGSWSRWRPPTVTSTRGSHPTTSTPCVDRRSGSRSYPGSIRRRWAGRTGAGTSTTGSRRTSSTATATPDPRSGRGPRRGQRVQRGQHHRARVAHRRAPGSPGSGRGDPARAGARVGRHPLPVGSPLRSKPSCSRPDPSRLPAHGPRECDDGWNTHRGRFGSSRGTTRP